MASTNFEPAAHFITLDIETTGLDPHNDEIIEIAAIRTVNGEVTEEFSEFVKPTRPVPNFIKILTNITDEQLASGLSCDIALKRLQAFLGDAQVVCHNSPFDIGFINAHLEKIGQSKLHNPNRDTLELARIYLPFLRDHKLGTVCEFFGIENESAHRAIHDARATAQVFDKLVRLILDEMPLKLNHNIQQLLDVAGRESASFLEEIVLYQQRFALLKKTRTRIFEVPDNILEHKPEETRPLSIEDIFDQDGRFSRTFEGYELREGQIEMAHAVEHAFREKEHLLVEAGTGVGKSLAYLIPSIRFTNDDRSKVVVTTNTKNLQEQLFNKDLPQVVRSVDIPFTAVILKGRDNYVCQRKWGDLHFDIPSLAPYEADALLLLEVWMHFTKTGDVSENSSFSRTRFRSVWKKACTERHFCNGRKCGSYKQCYLMRVRKAAEQASIVIVNHSLMLSDLLSNNATLGEYSKLIIDEAHNLPDIASSHLGVSIGHTDLVYFIRQIYSQRGRFQSGIIPQLKAAVTKSKIDKTTKDFIHNKCEEIQKSVEFDDMPALFLEAGHVVDKKGSYGKLRVHDNSEHPFIESETVRLMKFFDALKNELTTLRNAMTDIPHESFVDYDTHLTHLDGAIDRCKEFLTVFEQLLNPDFANTVFWMSSFFTKDPDIPNGIINLAPLDVDRKLKDLLYDRIPTIVFTSATLALRGSFKYFSNRVGVSLIEETEVRELVVPSPFNFEKQTEVCVASFLPEHNDRFYASQVTPLIKETLLTSRVGSMVLFTSYKDLNAMYESIGEEMYRNNVVLLAQGKGLSRTAMLDQFREHGSAVLLGTSSFWEGIDVQGKSLSLLILYKLPFQVPTDPIVEAYLERLKNQGKDSFMHYMLPNALLKYRQGFGRLIRHKTDRGVVMILDKRIETKYYGKFFRQITPTQIRSASNPVQMVDMVAEWFRRNHDR